MDGLNDFTAGVLLASASPRRRALLHAIGLPVRVRPVAIDESPWEHERPHAYVERLAREKGLTAKTRDAAWLAASTQRVLLAADTTVVLDGQILGKPADVQEGRAMLVALSGRQHRVLTAVYAATGEADRLIIDESVIQFRALAEREIDAYLATGEPFDKAGGYGIQGIGGVFVESLQGSFSGVAGLPVAGVEELLASLGVDSWALRGSTSMVSGSGETRA